MVLEVVGTLEDFKEDAQGGKTLSWPGKMNHFPTVPSHCGKLRECPDVSVQIVRMQYKYYLSLLLLFCAGDRTQASSQVLYH
jgi:hypothetical protein